MPRSRFRRCTVRIWVDYLAPEGLRSECATTLGAGGMFIESKDPLPEGTLLRLRFRLPEGDTLHEFEGRVAWVHRPPELERSERAPAKLERSERAPGMGIAFERASRNSALAKELENLPGVETSS